MQDDSDLSAAFEELTAPPSTANYATRTPGLEIRTSVSRWPQALATALAVLVAVGGAGTFLALRNARQGGAPSSSAGGPSARSGAAMAYDSTAGVTVMFGGTDGSGRPLTDTWTWDGSAWKRAAKGPGTLVDVRMVDDPAEEGVLLMGVPAPSLGQNSGTTGTGCVVGSGTVTTCPPIAVASTEQTWLFSAHGWNLAGAGSSASTPPAGAQLTFDSTTHQVVAVSSSFFNCGPPLESLSHGPAIACPVMGANSGKNSSLPINCAVVSTCLGNSTIETWTWLGGYWKEAPAGATLHQSGVTLLLDDPATQHATLMTQFDLGVFGGDYRCPGSAGPPSAPSCPAPLPLVTTWSWTGSGWNQVSQLQNLGPAPDFAGATVAAIGGQILVLTTSGQTWNWTAGRWTQDTVATHPSARFGAAMAQGPLGTVVLFGGAPNSGLAVTSSAGSFGSDTWLWKGKGWQQVGGTAPSPPPTPTCPPQSKGLIPPYCVLPVPAQVPPATPAGIPQAGPSSAQGSSGVQATP